MPDEKAGMIWDPLDELELKYNRENKEDYDELIKLITQILAYPSTEQADIHMDANRLGRKDLISEVNERKNIKADDDSQK